MPEFVLAPGAEETALAVMLSSMIESNLGHKPERVKDFNALNIGVGIVVADEDIKITLDFSKGTLTVHSGLVNNPALVITSEAEALMEMANINIKYGMPWYFDDVGMAMVKKLLKRELKVKGMFTHNLALTRLTKVFSVA